MKKTLFLLVLSTVCGCTHPEPTRYQILGIEQFQQIKQNPKSHIGRLCAFGGRVINTEKTAKQIVFQILVQNYISNSERNITTGGPLSVIYPGPETTVADGHQVKVLGYLRGPAVGKDLFGTTVSSLKLDAIAVYDSFTQYDFRLNGYEELFNNWKTGEPLTAGKIQKADGS